MLKRLTSLLPPPGGGVSAIIGFVILLAVWWSVCTIFDVRAVILPAPSAVWDAWMEMASAGSLSKDVLTSLVELVWGFLIGTLTGLVSGIAIARWRGFGAFLDPIVETFRFIVPFSLVPLVVVWFGVSIVGKIFIVSYACYFVVTINTAAAIRDIDPLILKAAAMLGITGRRLVLQVVLPAALPRILTGLQIAIAHAWVSVIAAEYVGATAGLGYQITNAQSGLETAKVMAGMVTIGVLGLVFSQIIMVIRRFATPHASHSAW